MSNRTLYVLGCLLALFAGFAGHAAYSEVSSLNGPAVPDLSDYPTKSQISALSPVQAVNGAQGSVVVPTVQRQSSGSMDAASGTVAWTFPTVFSNMPTCWVSITQADATYVFAAPVTTYIDRTRVTVSLKAAKQIINLLSFGAISVWNNPPAATTANLTCVGTLP